MKKFTEIRNDVYILAVGMTPINEHWERSLRELALEAIVNARSEAPQVRPEALYVANMLAPALSGQTHLGVLLADFAGMRGIEAMTIESASASGGVAFRQAYLALKSGMIDVALVLGVEKVTDHVGALVDAALSTATDADYEAIQGITPTAQAALLMRRYLYENQAPKQALSGFSINAHKNAVANSYAMYRKAIEIEQYEKAAMVCDPVNLYDAAPLADGAAAIVVANRRAIPDDWDAPLVRILASSLSTAALALHDQADPLRLQAAEVSVQKAYQIAGLTPDDVDFFELHDQFSILAALSLEAAGFAPKGEGWKLAMNGDIRLNGSIPICTFGGSKARGEVGGATGVLQIAEAARQLQDLAGENQVQNACIGLTQCLGGMGASAATHILARDDAQ
jgi:acetyl-CoA C-acetyltransferase